MPNIIEVKSPHIDKTMKIDLDLLLGNGNRESSDNPKLIRRFDGLEEKIKSKPDTLHLPIILSHNIYSLLNEAYYHSPLAIIDADEPTFTSFLEPQSLETEKGKYSFVDSAAGFATINAVKDTMRPNRSASQSETVRLSQAVNNIIHIMSCFHLDRGVKPSEIEISYVGRDLGDDDFIDVPGIFRSLDKLRSQTEENHSLWDSSFVSRACALESCKIENPTGLDATKGPIFGYSVKRSKFTVHSKDITSMIEQTIEDRQDYLDWKEVWKYIICGYDKNILNRLEIRDRLEILDRVETRSLQERLAPIIDPIFSAMENVISRTSDIRLIGNALKPIMANAKEEIASVVNQWNTEQSLYQYSVNKSSILTFKEGLSLRQITDTLYDSAKNALEQIAMMPRPDNLNRPWEAFAARKLEAAHTAMLDELSRYEQHLLSMLDELPRRKQHLLSMLDGLSRQKQSCPTSVQAP